MFFHFLHASSLFSYYFSKFRPNYKLVGCPMLMMGLASTSLLSEGSRRSFGMFCCLSVWGQIHERQTARGCVRYFCLVYFFVFVFVFVFVNRSWGEDKLMRGAQTEPVFARWRMIYLLGQEKTTRPLTDVFVFVLYVDISLFFGICKSCCWVIYLVDQEKTTRLFKDLCLSSDDKLYYPFFTLDWSFIPSHSHQTNTNLLFERK